MAAAAAGAVAATLRSVDRRADRRPVGLAGAQQTGRPARRGRKRRTGLPARRHARRQYHLIRPSQRPRRDSGAPDAARALPARRTAQRNGRARRDRRIRRGHRHRQLANMRPSPPSRPRSRILSDIVADQIVARLALYASRTDARRSEGDQGSDRPRGRPAGQRDPLLSFPRPGRGAVAGVWPRGCSKALGATKFIVAAGAVKADPAIAGRRSGRAEPVRRQARDLDRTCDQGHRGRRRRAV